MAISVGAVMRACNHYFEAERWPGDFTVSGGTLSGADGTPLSAMALPGQYVAILGTAGQDGVYQLTADGGVPLDDQTFSGQVVRLAPPRAFLDLCADIAAYGEANPDTTVVAERFGAYSVSRATRRNGAVTTWREVFSSRLTPYRRMFPDIEGV